MNSPAFSGSLTIVVIGLNEAAHLADCFRSIYAAAAYWSGGAQDVVYVDSGSQDESIELARRYADRIFALRSPISAAAARDVGLLNATGDYVLFLDGDMELDTFWWQCVSEYERNGTFPRSVIGLIGMRHDIYVDETTRLRLGEQENVYRTGRARTARHIGGALLIRRDILLKAQGYQPDLRGSEEPDLYARLRGAGYDIWEIPCPFIRHHTPMPASWPRRVWRELFSNRLDASFGLAFWRALTGGYIRGWLDIYRPTALVWCVDGITLLLLTSARWWGAAFVQVIMLSWLLVTRRTKLFVTARARLYAAFMSVFLNARRINRLWMRESLGKVHYDLVDRG